MLTNGKIFTIENDFLHVRLGSVGAALLGGMHKEYGDFLVHIGDDEFSEGYVGKTIVPWVNRIKNGEYVVDGKKYFLPINDVQNNSALHGFVAWSEFSVDEHTKETITFSSFIYPSPSFPFKTKVLVTYFLQGDILKCRICVQNLSDVKIPIGICAHPYIKHPNSSYIDECAYSITVDCPNECEENSKSLTNLSLDDCYEIGRSWKVTLRHQDLDKFPVRVVLSSNSKFLQLYSGESVSRKGFAVEPCTTGVDMYGETKNGDWVDVGSSKELEYEIRLEK